MRHWSSLAIRNWWARASRTAGAVAAIAVGAAAVVWVTCCYESVRRVMADWSAGYIGESAISVGSPKGKYDQIPERLKRTLATVDNVKSAAAVLIQRLYCEPWPNERLENETPWPPDVLPTTPEVDVYGVEIPEEFTVRDYRLTAGRKLAEGDKFACMLEAQFATDQGLKLGDSLLVWTTDPQSPFVVKIVGLIDRKRLGRIQKPIALMPLSVLQEITQKFALVTSIDLVLRDATREKLRITGAKVRQQVVKVDRYATLRSAEARMQQIELAQSNQQFLMIMLSCVAMLTALFIILSTLSMGMVERIGQLGLLRLIGMTRMQLGLLVLMEVFPIGMLGILLGVPLGLGLTLATVWLEPDYVGEFAVSMVGIGLAVGAGLLTTLVAGLLPAFAALRVTPLEAAHPRARRASNWLLVVVALAAIGLLAVQHFLALERVQRATWFVQAAAATVTLLYLGYAMFSPLAVRLVGSPATRLAAFLLSIRARLLDDQVGVAVWRSAGVCCGLMVGLSMIIGILVVNESVTGGWQFPKQFPEAYIWSFDNMTPDAAKLIAGTPGVKNFTAANSINVIVDEVPYIGAEVLKSVTWFMGCDPDSFFDLVRMEFLEGDAESAKRKLKQGGYVIIADDFARSRGKNMDDEVTIYFGTTSYRSVRLKVAGVVRSPAVDIAANYFQLQTEYNVVAAGSVMGSIHDLKRLFGVDGVKLVLVNFDLPANPPPADWPPPRDTPAGSVMPSTYFNTNLPLETRWRRYREDAVLRTIREKLKADQAYYGAFSELKLQIDQQLSEMMQLLAAVPTVALVVAAMGVANLMTANVAARAKQLAILRAVGATRGLVLRMVIGEAVVLGLLGSGLGMALGLHLASNITTLIERMWGFRVAITLPWGYLAGCVALTVILCVVAGLIPARRAARTNIVDALHVV